MKIHGQEVIDKSILENFWLLCLQNMILLLALSSKYKFWIFLSIEKLMGSIKASKERFNKRSNNLTKNVFQSQLNIGTKIKQRVFRILVKKILTFKDAWYGQDRGRDFRVRGLNNFQESARDEYN